MKNMTIVETIISMCATKILKDMEDIAEKLGKELDLSPVKHAQQGIQNKELLKKMQSKQILLVWLKAI